MDQNLSNVVIVGAGLAGVSIVAGLRKNGFAGPVILVSEKTEASYDRPPLSKQFLLDGNADRIRIPPEKQFRSQ